MDKNLKEKKAQAMLLPNWIVGMIIIFIFLFILFLSVITLGGNKIIPFFGSKNSITIVEEYEINSIRNLNYFLENEIEGSTVKDLIIQWGVAQKNEDFEKADELRDKIKKNSDLIFSTFPEEECYVFQTAYGDEKTLKEYLDKGFPGLDNSGRLNNPLVITSYNTVGYEIRISGLLSRISPTILNYDDFKLQVKFYRGDKC